MTFLKVPESIREKYTLEWLMLYRIVYMTYLRRLFCSDYVELGIEVILVGLCLEIKEIIISAWFFYIWTKSLYLYYGKRADNPPKNIYEMVWSPLL